MENIIINEIITKDSGLVILKLDGGRDATMNTKWQKMQVDYIKNEVGVGGSVIVELTQKGDFLNVTKLDMTSGKKGVVNNPNPSNLPNVEVVKVSEVPKETRGFNNTSVSIVAQVCLKEACEFARNLKGDLSPLELGQFLNETINELVGAYKGAVELLQNG